jgi:hypothetical protein
MFIFAGTENEVGKVTRNLPGKFSAGFDKIQYCVVK